MTVCCPPTKWTPLTGVQAPGVVHLLATRDGFRELHRLLDPEGFRILLAAIELIDHERPIGVRGCEPGFEVEVLLAGVPEVVVKGTEGTEGSVLPLVGSKSGVAGSLGVLLEGPKTGVGRSVSLGLSLSDGDFCLA